jgi:hypothetical protein
MILVASAKVLQRSVVGCRCWEHPELLHQGQGVGLSPMLAELAVGDAIDGGRGHVEFPSGRWDIAKVLGEVTAGSDARCHEITFGDLVEDLMSARSGVKKDLA